jgi:hypothetical protein
MLDLAYQSLRREAGDACLIGPASETPNASYVWHYWLPWMAMLDPERLRLCQVEQGLVEGRPFAFPLELRWEFIEQARRHRTAGFLTPHVPPGVLTAARAGRAIILLFFGHEARPLSYIGADQQLGAYDYFLDFVLRHDLPRGALWFVSGNLTGRSEYESWKRQHVGGSDAPDPFETRFVEPFSYLAQAALCVEERGFDLLVESKGSTDAHGAYRQEAIRLALSPIGRRLGNPDPDPARLDGSLPPKLFLCMNRRPHGHRRKIVCHLLRRGHLERSLVSFRDDKPKAIHWGEAALTMAWRQLRKRQPLTIDRELPLDYDTYFRDNPSAIKNGDPWPYRDSCYSIITETHFTNDRLFVSEKLWKPIMNRHPFLVVGTPGTLAYLQSLGFRTFNPAIDERYDSLTDDRRRMRALFVAIDALGALDDQRRAAMLKQMQPILAHNECHLRHLETPMAQLLHEVEARLTSVR